MIHNRHDVAVLHRGQRSTLLLANTHIRQAVGPETPRLIGFPKVASHEISRYCLFRRDMKVLLDCRNRFILFVAL